MYTPKDFEKHKMHCLKYLWIFHKRSEIIKDIIQDSEDDLIDGLAFGEDANVYMDKIVSALSYSKQILQFTTGMNDQDLNEALKIGSVLAEFIIASSLTEEERDSYFGMIDDPVELTDMQAFRLKTIREKIESVYDGSSIDSIDFDDIISRNFGKESNGEQEGS